MIFGSLFSGIGGFDAGFEQAGLECAWQVEIDETCRRVLVRHFPTVAVHSDVKSVSKSDLAAVDVICGGFPCQDLSVAGKREGLAGERSGLWFEFHRILEELRPRWCVIENVPGLLSSNGGRDFAIILRGLVELGYGVAYRILDAQYWGIPQRRRRVFIVGSLGDGSCAEILFEPESGAGDSPPSREAGARVAAYAPSSFGDYSEGIGPIHSDGSGGTRGNDSLIVPILEAGARQGLRNSDRDGIGIGKAGDPMFTLQSGKQHAVASTLKQRGRGATDEVMDNLQIARPITSTCYKGHDEDTDTLVAAPLTAGMSATKGVNPPGRRKEDDVNLVCATLNSGGNSGGFRTEPGEHLVTHALRSEGADASEDGTGRGTPIIPIDFRQTSRGEVFTNNRPEGSSGGAPGIGVGNAGDPSFTVSGRQQAAAGGFGVRRLTPTECERLQGFPDGWTAHDADRNAISDSTRYRMLGNAVAVPCAAWLGTRIIEARAALTSPVDCYLHIGNGLPESSSRQS